MDKIKIKSAAIKLEKLLDVYAEKDIEVEKLFSSLRELLSEAKSGLINEPIKSIPGSYWFLEKNMYQYQDLEKSYVEFKKHVTKTPDEINKYEFFLKSFLKERKNR